MSWIKLLLCESSLSLVGAAVKARVFRELRCSIYEQYVFSEGVLHDKKNGRKIGRGGWAIGSKI